MRSIKVKLALGLAGASALCVMLGMAAPASADPPPSGVTFWSGAFAGQTVNYANPSTGCTTLPFTVHSELNNTSKSIQVYATTDCTGQALTFPASDIHSFTGFDGRSFRALD
ncbi:hypothetical protein [Sorangium sp. So ce1151]|uniref:hypothetical protein n=1 Tax=Sorangium sp. So ce1151 TaxID=3133332 RepID=UPI003F5FF843